MKFDKVMDLKGYDDFKRTIPFIDILIECSYILRDHTISPENRIRNFFYLCSNGYIRENNREYDINDKSMRKAQYTINSVEIMIYNVLIQSSPDQHLRSKKNQELLANHMLREWIDLMDGTDVDLLEVS